MLHVGRRRAIVTGFATAALVAGAFIVGTSVASGAGTTNGDPITFGKVSCAASVGTIHLSQPTDVPAQAVVPNQVNQGDSYTITIPGGPGTLPHLGAGLPISQFKNLSSTYEFDSSSGSVNITAVSVAGGGSSGTVTWDKNDGSAAQTLPFNVTNTANTVTLTTPGPLVITQPHDGTLTTPDVTLTVTAPLADATVTSYLTEFDTTATLSLGDAVTTCPAPHSNPQTDGISATLVGAGGPTTSSEPACRQVGGNCDNNTTTTSSSSTTSSSIGATTTTTVPSGPTLFISDASALRPSSGTAKMTFIVTMSKAATSSVTVKYATADNTAVQPTDYKKVSGTLTIRAGKTSGTISVSITGGLIGQPAKTFFMNLSAPHGASLSRAQGIGTITDLHFPGITIQDAAAPVPVGRNAVMSFNVVLTKPVASKQICKVPYTTSDVTATAGIDYKTKHGTLSIGVGKISGVIKITILKTATPGDLFIVQAGVPTNCVVQDGVGVGTIG